jgi:hypothetical protein
VKNREKAAKILLKKGWTLDEANEVLAPPVVVPYPYQPYYPYWLSGPWTAPFITYTTSDTVMAVDVDGPDGVTSTTFTIPDA